LLVSVISVLFQGDLQKTGVDPSLYHKTLVDRAEVGTVQLLIKVGPLVKPHR